ncbi:colicin release lysis protein (plasmid) [Klebsiella pneumoniae]|nr:colicin release lysis protein [Klebsiella pneumoniae]
MKKVKVVFLFILIFSGFLLVACQAGDATNLLI